MSAHPEPVEGLMVRLGMMAVQDFAALRQAARTARKTARMYGTPIYVWENGKDRRIKSGARLLHLERT